MKFFGWGQDKKEKSIQIVQDGRSITIEDIVDELKLNSKTEQYKNGLVFFVMNFIAEQVSRFDFKIINSAGEQIKNDFWNKFKFAEGFSSSYEFVKYLILSLIYHGKTLVVDADKLILTNDFTLTHKNGKTSVKLGGKELQEGDYILFQLRNNPESVVNSFSLLDILQKEINTYVRALNFASNFYEGGAFGSVVKTTAQAEDVQKYTKLADAITKRLKLNKLAFIPSGWELQKIASTEKDVVNLQVIEKVDEIVARVFGIPNTFLGKLKNSGSYALSREERKSFYQDTLDNWLTLIEGAFTKHLQKRYGDFEFVRDITYIDYLQQDKLTNADKVINLFSVGLITQEEARTLLGFTEGEKNKNIFVRKNVYKIVEEERVEVRNLWHDRKIKPIEGDIADYWQYVFKNMRDTILLAQQSEVTEDFVKHLLVTNITETKEKMLSFYGKVGRRATKEFLADLKLSTGMDDLVLMSLYVKRANWLVDRIINTTTNKLTSLIEKTRRKNFYDDLISVFDMFFQFCYNTSKTIGRTEANYMINEVHEANARWVEENVLAQSDKMMKLWSSARDEKVRETHMKANNQGWIDYKSKFDLNGVYADRPYDPLLPSHEVTNCRCTLLFEIK